MPPIIQDINTARGFFPDTAADDIPEKAETGIKYSAAEMFLSPLKKSDRMIKAIPTANSMSPLRLTPSTPKNPPETIQSAHIIHAVSPSRSYINHTKDARTVSQITDAAGEKSRLAKEDIKAKSKNSAKDINAYIPVNANAASDETKMR